MADDTPMPGRTEFSAEEESAMRTARGAQNASPQWSVTPKGQAALAGATRSWSVTPKGRSALLDATNKEE